jgi:DUF1680 family protein
MPASIQDPFWSLRLQVNAEKAIFHQWEQLEASGCIENFRIAAGLKEGLREGWYFADSDAYKWLDAASNVYASNVERQTSEPRPSTLRQAQGGAFDVRRIKNLIDDFIALLSRAQCDDGYLYTYNQIHFPGSRWENLLIEHELYCHGHLIEAGVSHFEATGETSALSIARKAADLLVRDFMDGSPLRTDGHEEIEIALLRLYQVTGHAAYRDLASALLERRGRAHPFAPHLIAQNDRVEKRKKAVEGQRQIFLSAHPEYAPFQVPPGNYAKAPRTSRLRWVINALTGKYFQMHAPLREQTVPVGHAVRFGYLETATAMLLRLTGDRSLLPAMQQAWDRMVTRFMFVSGGLGAVPGLEGFGRDDELDPLYAYAETCAALASLFWNWEMAQITGEAKYSDLFEWQLYNAAAPGMGLDGDGYLYNNPLACRGGVTRRAWFAVPCCPSNLSRTWASLGKYIYSSDEKNLWVHQYIGSNMTVDGGRWTVEMESGLPWEGKVRLTITLEKPDEFTLHLRLPSWAGKTSIRVNGEPVNLPTFDLQPATASGYDPRTSRFLPITRAWTSGDVVELDFEMPITFRRADRRVRGHRGKVAVTRGPLLYCLESVDNPDIDIFTARLDTRHALSAAYAPTLLGGTEIISGKTTDGKDLTFIPYHLWANRGESQMTVWVNA